MKRIVLGILFVLFVFSMSTGVFANVGAESDIAVENDGQLLSDSAIDAEILARINDLYAKVGNTYFNVDHSTGCGKKSSGHYCPNCLSSSIVKQDWFKKIFGECSTEQFPASYYGEGSYTKSGYSCLGFSQFAQWYIFKESNSDYIYSQKIGTYSYNNSNIANYAQVGDNLRLTNSYSTSSGHSVIYIGINSAGTGIEVLDCNYGTAYNCMVRKHTVYFSEYSYVTITRTTNRNSIVPETEPPTNCSITLNKTVIKAGDTVTFTISADKATKYSFGIGDGTNVLVDTGILYNNSYSYTFTKPGTYYVWGYAANSIGGVDISGVTFVVYGNIDSASIVSSSAASKPGEAVTFSILAENATAYSFGIGDGTNILLDTGITENNSCTYTFEKSGTYYVWGYAENPISNMDIIGVSYVVYDSVKNANIISSATIIPSGNSCTFVMSAENATAYAFGIGNGKEVVCETGIISNNTLEYTFNVPGTYYIWGYAENPVCRTDVNAVKCIVFDSNTGYIEAEVENINNSSYMVTVNLYNISNACRVLIAGYNNNRFVDLKNVTYKQEEISEVLEGNIDAVKIMLWNSLFDIKPLYEMKIVTASDFITQ